MADLREYLEQLGPLSLRKSIGSAWVFGPGLPVFLALFAGGAICGGRLFLVVKDKRLRRR